MNVVNVAEWEPQQRRTGSIVALVLAVALAGAGLAVWYFLGVSDVVYWSLAGVLGLVLLFVLTVLFLGIRAERAQTHPAFAPHIGPAGPAMADEPRPAATEAQVRTMTLRCGDCGTEFDITDTGERPLYHTCPGCGAEGVLRTPPAAAPAASAPAPAEAPAPAPDSVWAPPQEEPAEVVPPVAPPRRLKLRCGGCKEIFVIEDTGERPLRRPCPHCSRMGEIK